MMSELNRPSWFRAPSALVLAGMLALTGSTSLVLAAESAGPVSTDSTQETFTWSAELVSFDAAERTVTVRRRVEYHADIDGWTDLREGDAVTITWAGIRSAAGIRNITRGDAAPQDGLTLPAEFVAIRNEGAYVDFRVPVLAQDVARIETIEPGSWVTATSPRGAAVAEASVIGIRGYNDVS